MKKLIALVLALALVLAVAVASAATITVNATNASSGTGVAEYKAYKLFSVTKATSGDTVTSWAYSISDATLKGLLETVKTGANNSGDTAAFTFTPTETAGTYSVSANWTSDETTNKNVAANILSVLGSRAADYTFTTAGDHEVTDGYYLVTSSLGTNLGLATTDIEFDLVEKNDWPGVTKEDNKVTAEIGDEDITYTVEVTIPENVASHDIVVTDTATNGLTFNMATGAIAVTEKVEGTAITTLSWTKSDDTTATINTKAASIYTTTIPAATVVAQKGKTLVLTYTAKLNEDAIEQQLELNKVKITYDRFTTVETTPVDVKYVGFDLEKVDGTTGLAGVKFTLTRDGLYYTEPSNNDNKNEARFQATEVKITTGADGTYHFTGLHAGTYTLTETDPLPGYNPLKSSIDVTVAEDGKVTYTYDGNTTTGAVKIQIQNNKGTELPSTGGIGTTIFYVLGGLLVIGAAVILVARRKASN